MGELADGPSRELMGELFICEAVGGAKGGVVGGRSKPGVGGVMLAGDSTGI